MEATIRLIWFSLFDAFSIWFSICCRIGGSEVITAVASRTVTLTGGSSGFGVSLVVIFCTRIKRELSLKNVH